MQLFKIVGSFELDKIEVQEGEDFQFRLDVFHDEAKNIFFGKVYRLETYRLQPTFPQDDEGKLPNSLNDGLIFILDESIDSHAIIGHSIEEVKNKFINEINIIFFE